MNTGTRAFVTLDGLRGIAAFMVLTRHAVDYFPQFPESYLAVDFFFILSGFVLAHAYGQKLRDGMSAGEFFAVRFIRLYPLYALALSIATASLVGQTLRGEVPIEDAAVDILSAFLFLPSPASPALFPLNGPSWSLFFELTANTAFGIFWRRAGTHVLAVVVGISGIVLIASVVTGALGFGNGSGTGVMDKGFEWNSIGAGFVRVVYSFSCGCLLYRIWSIRPPRMSVPPLLMAGLLFAVLALVPPRSCGAIYDLVATILIFPLLVWLAASSAAQGLVARTFTVLGAASYAVYVLQAPLYGVSKIVERPLTQLAPGLLWIVFSGLMLVVALVIDAHFDRPIRIKLMLLLKSWSAQAPLRSAAHRDLTR